MREVDLAWAAGLFEGEGCFYLRRITGKNSVHLGATLVMADEEVVRKFHRIVGIGYVMLNQRRLQHPHHSVTWKWQANGIAVMDLFDLIGAHLGDRRTEKYEEILKERCLYEEASFADHRQRARFAFTQGRLP